MSFDATQFTVFGIPPYVFFVGIGALAAFFVYNCVLRFEKADFNLGNKAIICSVPLLMIGAKLFGIIANVAENIRYETPITIDTFIYSGIVFYGGLIFFALSFLYITRKCETAEKAKIYDALACTIPIFHAFGRVGCFTAGCCFGTDTESPLGIEYTTWVNGAVITETRFPVQLVESFANLLIFALLFVIVLRKKNKGKNLIIYIGLYSFVRFFDEFIRYSNKAKLFGLFSAAQVISIVFLIAIVIILLKERKNKCLTKMNGQSY